VIAFAHQGRLWLVLDEENVERIQQNDPCDFDGRKAPGVLALRVPLAVSVAYAKASEMAKIQELAENPSELVQYLARGFKVTASDHDRPYDVYNSLGTLRDVKKDD
jgi:hypothetical protein